MVSEDTCGDDEDDDEGDDEGDDEYYEDDVDDYFKPFSILVQITIKSPDLLQNRSQKSPDSTWKSFFPLLQHNSAQSPDGKILEGKHWT